MPPRRSWGTGARVAKADSGIRKAFATGLSDELKRLLREAGVLLLLPVALYLFVCLASYSSQDPGWSHAGSRTPVHNFGGTIGAFIADLLLGFFGWPVPMRSRCCWLALAWRVLRGGGVADARRWNRPCVCSASSSFFIAGRALAFLHLGARPVCPPGRAAFSAS